MPATPSCEPLSSIWWQQSSSACESIRGLQLQRIDFDIPA